MRRAWVAVAAALVSAGCGSISQPLPPALQVPQRVIDLSAVEQGNKIVVQFTWPVRTTENLLIRKPISGDLAVGVAGTPFDQEAWAASAKRFTDIPVDQPIVKFGVPAAEWIGRNVVIGVQVLGANGRSAGWSNVVALSLVAPLAQPQDLVQKDVAEGVQLTWYGNGPMYRVYRRVGDAENAAALAEIDRPSYTDTAIEYGKTYHYSVEAFRTAGDVHAMSDRTAEVEITPIDTWPPPVPAGLAAVASPGRIELVWEPSIAPDLAGYRVYRAEGNGPFTKVVETREGPSYSDVNVAAGKSYRYAVSAFDQTGHESEKSPPVSIQAQ